MGCWKGRFQPCATFIRPAAAEGFVAKLKRVAIGKKRIAVIDHDKTETYEWPEVKSIKMVPYFNLYKLKLRGKKDRIYFLPEQPVEPLFGLFPGEPELAEALRKRGK